MEKHIDAGDSERSPVASEIDIRDDAILHEVSKEEERKIMHKIDRRLVLLVGILYCISLMDRTNLSAANIAGMSKDLGLEVGFRYSIITLVFFTTYVFFQFPSTVIIKKIGPRIHIGTICLLWGAVMIGMGFVKNWQSLAGLRVILGIFEAGYFPGSVYLLSTWYKRYEMQKRYSVFYMIGSLASACAGIMAYGIMQMNGTAGLAGWRWIFIIEGIITCVLALIGYVVLVDFPDKAGKNKRFLTARELQFVIARINADRADAIPEPFTWSAYLRGAIDPKVWGFAMLFGMSTTVTYALAYFLPLILVSGMGFSIAQAQCLVAPPYAFAAILMYTTAWIGDKYRMRGALIFFNSVLCIIGLAVMGYATNLGARYFAVFLVTGGANSNIPTVLTYQANNIRGHWKRAFCSATLVGMGGVGGIIGSLIFRSQDSPQYHPGLWGCMVSQAIILVIVIALSIHFHFANKKADRGEKIIEGISDFRYTF